MPLWFVLPCAVIGTVLTIWLLVDVRKTYRDDREAQARAVRINQAFAEEFRRSQVDAAFQITGAPLLHRTQPSGQRSALQAKGNSQ